MRKILSAALALFCVWFASPAWGANCNLTQRIINKTYTGVGSSVGDEHAVISDITYKENTPYTITIDVEPSNVTFSEQGNLLWWSIKYTDGSFDYTGVTSYNYNNGRVSVTTAANKTVFSITGLSNHQRWTGGTLKVSNLQIEEGTTATPYQPYNPLCATCDGTVVNYTSATGTVSQSGTPTPTNPIYPTFYQQGNMVLRKVGNYADSYDATTGKITRRVAVVVFDGTESWAAKTPGWEHTLQGAKTGSDGLMLSHFGFRSVGWSDVPVHYAMRSGSTFRINYPEATTAAELKSWLAAQYAAGTPVTVWYPLAEPVEEDWTETSYCSAPIKIATTKYNESAFGPLNTALANAISVVDSVVSNTITQAASIATLQTQKQTRPNDIADDNEKCPAGKKCLLVEDASGIPHWYEIVENAWDLPVGYTQLQYIESTGTQYIDTGVYLTNNHSLDVKFMPLSSETGSLFGVRNSSAGAGFGITGQTSLAVDLYGAGQLSQSRLSQAISLNNIYSVHMESGNRYIKNAAGTTLGTNTVVADAFTINKSAPLFAINWDTNEVRQFGWFRVYEFTLKENGTAVRDFVPAKNSSGVVGMYDKVSGEFFENKGTGEFIAGDPVVE